MSDSRTEVNEMTYICKSDGTGLVKESSGYLGNVVVLCGFIEMNGKRYVLKEIGKFTFSYSAIKSLRIPNNVEVIGAECFRHCKSLDEIRFESGSKLKEIGKSAFNNSVIITVRSSQFEFQVMSK
jgi:hypothetical protein